MGILKALKGAREHATLDLDSYGAVCLSSDGRKIYCGNDDSVVTVWDIPTKKWGQKLVGKDKYGHSMASMHWLSLSQDGHLLLAGGKRGTSPQFWLWDLRSGQCLKTFENDDVNCARLHPNGRFAVMSIHSREDECGKLQVWEAATGRCLRTFGELSDYASFWLSPDGRMAVTGGKVDEGLKCWDLASGNCVRKIEGQIGIVSSVSFSADGRRILCGSSGPSAQWSDKELRPGEMKLWDLASGKCLRSFEGSANEVCLSPNGQIGISGVSDGTIRLWGIAKGQSLRTLSGHNKLVTEIHLSHDCRYLVSWAWDKKLKVWELTWEFTEKPQADWDDRVTPFLEIFLNLHAAPSCTLSDKRTPTDEEIARALTPSGKPGWKQEDFQQLLATLDAAGLGWVRPDGIRKKLEELAATWKPAPAPSAPVQAAQAKQGPPVEPTMDYCCTYAWPYSDDMARKAREFYQKLLSNQAKFPFRSKGQVALAQSVQGSVFVALQVLASSPGGRDTSVKVDKQLRHWFEQSGAPDYQDYNCLPVNRGGLHLTLGVAYRVLESFQVGG